MKKLLALFLILLVSAATYPAMAAGKVHHVVCFKFKSTASGEDIKKVEQAFAGLKEKVSGIETLKWGTNVSKEQRNKGFTHCFVLTFKTEQARDGYLEHPEHKAFGKLVGPLIDDVFVIDFVPKKEK